MKIAILTLVNILITISLLTSPFLIGVTASVREYNSWADYDGDGKIDIRDIASTAIAYGTSGDPNRNVTVTNFPLDEQGNLKVTLPYTSPSRQRDGLEITVLDWSSRYVGTTPAEDYGIKLASDPISFPFAFTPNGSSANVTELWVAAIISRPSDRDFNFTIKLNSLLTTSTITRTLSPLGISTTNITDAMVLDTIGQGINVLTLSNPMEWYWEESRWRSSELAIYQLTIYIEYECLR